ncbi:MAG: SLC13 family permease [Phycisphaerae bacterium]
MRHARLIVALLTAGLAYAGLSAAPWHGSVPVRRAAGLVAATLVMWVSESAPLGVVALGVPVAATLAGQLAWRDAVAVWGDPLIFLNLGAFLLARALDKHGTFAWVARLAQPGGAPRLVQRAGSAPIVMLVSGAISTVQNNTAVTAMLLPAVTQLARRARTPAAVLMALSLGATFGGMATPIGTAPNFLGYSQMKRIDASVSFLSWMRVGVVAWIGTTVIGLAVLAAAGRMWRRSAAAGPAWIDPLVVTDVGPERGPARESADEQRVGRRVAVAALVVAALLWLVPGIVKGWTAEGHPWRIWVDRYLPESLVPIGICWTLFLIPTGGGRTVLDRHDFQALDWDTLFLFAGGLCLGRVLEVSGADQSLAHAVAAARVAPWAATAALAGATVLLSEMTSNTATAALMVPIAAPLAGSLGLTPGSAVMLVALCSSLGFALPVSTPPNALIYSTRLVPLRFMVLCGVAVDLLAAAWVVMCVGWLA